MNSYIGRKMVDIVNESVCPKMMDANKGKNSKPELLLRKLLHGKGICYRIHIRSLPGSLGLVLAKYKLAIFVLPFITKKQLSPHCDDN